jgi:hypothetical protein
MNQGCCIFAFDGDIAYGLQAVLAAGLVNKHLNIPVSLVTDKITLEKIDPSNFDQIIVTEIEDTGNSRVLSGKQIAFKNINRNRIYDLTPYDRTLLIDSDFLVFSNRLKEYLDSDYDFMICENMKDLCPNRPGSSVSFSPQSLHMLWATNIIFNKTPENKILFDLVDHIRENWAWYGTLYQFDTRRFRNDYAFTVACHVMGGFGAEKYYTALPSPILFNDRDSLLKITDTGLTWAVSDQNILVKTTNQDIHMMNKIELLEKIDALVNLHD